LGTLEQFRRLAWAASLLTVGIIVGIVLAIVTVILPRKHELSRAFDPSGFLAGFNPYAAVAAAAAGPVNVVESRDDRDSWGNRLCGKSFVYKCQIKPAQQALFFQSLNGGIQARLMRRTRRPRQSFIYGSGSSSSTGPDWRLDSQTNTYQEGGAQGLVRVWSYARGDDVVVIVNISER
jgi:hypothetical protein